MQIFHGLPAAPLSSESALTIGVFDGIHLGHQWLIGQTLRRARAAQRLCGVLTFDPHPVEVLAPHVAIRYLTSIAERAELVAQLGADFFCVIPFTHETAQTRARDFVRPLVDRLRMRDLFIGHDFTLGHNRQGNAEFLRALGAEWGFALQAVEPLLLDGEIVSSTRIRKALSAGQIEEATKLLGHYAGLRGRLNSDLDIAFDSRRQIPADGLYACRFRAVASHAISYDCVIRIAHSHVRAQSGERVDALIGNEVALEFVARVHAPVEAHDGRAIFAPLPQGGRDWEGAAPYEEIEHTADIAIRARGHTFEELLRRAAQGMFALMTDITSVAATSQIEVVVEGMDRETLLVNWLSELLYQSEMTNQVFREFEVSITAMNKLRGVARGGPSGEIHKQIKAVTFHDLAIAERDGLLETTIVFDV